MISPATSGPAAIVLTGGQSRRMGTDKAALVVDGLAMVDRVLAVLAKAGVTQIVVAGPGGVSDAASGDGDQQRQGPMAGVTGAWEYLQPASPDPVVVLSCDLPALTDSVVASLVTRSLHHRHGAIAHDGERQQPLIAAYRPAALDEIQAAFARGDRSLRRCFEGWDLGTVAFDPTALADADTPADLEAYDVEWPS